MQCEECGGETFVTNTRSAPMNTIRRRRECQQCGKRTTTFESPVSPLVVIKHRAKQAERKRRMWAKMSPEERRAYKRREHRRADARAEARSTGTTVEAIYREWDVQ